MSSRLLKPVIFGAVAIVAAACLSSSGPASRAAIVGLDDAPNVMASGEPIPSVDVTDRLAIGEPPDGRGGSQVPIPSGNSEPPVIGSPAPFAIGATPAVAHYWPAADRTARDSSIVLHVPILLYHRIVPESVGHCRLAALCMPPSMFDAELRALAAAGWHTVTLAVLAGDLARGTPPAQKTFVITIDDGYRDGLVNGLPILRRYGFVATYFIVSGRLGRPGVLRQADLVTLARAGMEIGDHTVSHVNLVRQPPAGLVFEIMGAAQAISTIVGEPPTCFAYPFGDRNEATVAAVAGSGFGAAVVNRNIGLEDWADRFSLPRLEVGRSTPPAQLLAVVARYSRHLGPTLVARVTGKGRRA